MSTPSLGRQPGTTRFQSARRGGFTLIEVAIALAIFVFGALAIVQIFPPALGVIRNNESRITATQMGENTLAQFKNKTSPPPEAIFDVDAGSTAPYSWNDYPAAVVGTSNKNNSLPKSVTSFGNSSLGHFRYIYGEPHYFKVGQNIFLNHPHSTTDGPVLAFRDFMIESVQVDKDGNLDFTNAYRVDSGTPFNDGGKRPPLAYRRTTDPTTDTLYYVSYRWREAATPNVIRGVLEEPLSIPSDTDWLAGTDPARLLPCVINSGNKVIPGSIQVKMRKSIPSTPSGSGNSITIVSTSTAGLYYFSYLARDWRELTNDSALVNNQVQLPVAGIEDNSVFPVFGVLTNSNYTLDPPVPSAAPFPSVDYKKGIVTYNFPATPGARVRTVYRALDGWAIQPSVAPRTYVPYVADQRPNNNFPREPWREYVWLPGDPSNIYFHASEAGKTVAISYGVNNVPNRTTLTIDNIQDAPSGLPSGFAPSGKVARATLIQPNGNAATTANAILSVQGLSIQARTAWLNADKYNQVIVPGYRNLMQ